MGKVLTEKRKKSIMISIILWLILAIVFVVPFSVLVIDSSYNGVVKIDAISSNLVEYLLSFEVRAKAFSEAYQQNTLTGLGYYSFFFFGVVLILFLKSKDKGSYHNIEHGSSDWSEGGEQYKVLSKKEGIILAEKNFLPVDKPGNVNVLIVGRIWCW